MLRRIWLIVSRDIRTQIGRPMIWVWVVLITFFLWGLSAGGVQIGTGGDSAIGGTKQHLTSEFEVARLMTAFSILLHCFFGAILFGMSVIRDEDTGIMSLLHSSRLRAAEYLAGKFLSSLLIATSIVFLTALIAIFFNHVVPHPGREEYFGEFLWANYWKPICKLVLPTVLLTGGLAFLLGTVTRKPILVFTYPTVMLLLFGLFLNNWSPVWLPNWANDGLNLIDPYGVRWLNETYFNVDRGADFYNTQTIELGTGFLISRVVMVVVGFLCLTTAYPVFMNRIRGRRHGSLDSLSKESSQHVDRARASAEAAMAGLGSLGMRQEKSNLIRDTWNIMRYELKELRFSPSLYLFVPFIIIEVVGTSFFTEGAFGTPLLHTSGSLAMGAMGTLVILGCLLLMFYTVESQLRERIKKLAPIFYSTPARSFAMLMGKSLANAGMCAVIVMAAFVACFFIMAYQGTVNFEIKPFLLVWGLLVMPTFILWSAFITLVIVLTRSRYTTYAIGAIALVATFYINLSGDMSWLTNWMLADQSIWSDISILELDRTALILNRMFVLSVSVLFTYLAARVYWRRGFDAVQMATRLRPRPILGFALKALPFAILPLVIGGILWNRIDYGHQGEAIDDLQKNYRLQNVATWWKVKPPSVSGVDIWLDIEPQDQAMEVVGTLRLINGQEEPISRFVLTGGAHWKNLVWKISEKSAADKELPKFPSAEDLGEIEPENRSGLFVFELDQPLEPGETIRLQYSFDGRYPDGISKNGGGQMEFILPTGVILNSFGTAIVPQPGFNDSIGHGDDTPEAEIYQNDFHEEKLEPLFGGGDSFHVRTVICGPESFTFNGVGIKKSDDVQDSRRTVVWESDSPVSFFNVAGGEWEVHKGESTEIYYHAKHDYNIEQISEALDAARLWYSRWFAPYPWRDLRLNEFPDMSTYAQGFATNITFSEGIGFLTKDKPGADAPFMVAAHEAAHQWWGNILVPGQGPGGNILSEGMAHFSTGLLFDQVKGERSRIEFFKLIEDQYGNRRSVDSERAMIFVDGSKNGDQTVMYDRGGWVFWMLLNEMGRRDNLQGIQTFIRKYSEQNEDYPVLQDFVAHMRDFAKDKEGFDQFCDQWIFDTVVPQYKFKDVEINESDGRWRITGKVENVGTGKTDLEIAAASKKRYVENQPNPEYQDSRTTVLVGTGETVNFELESQFKPDRLLVDPDAKVLQLERKNAEHKF